MDSGSGSVTPRRSVCCFTSNKDILAPILEVPTMPITPTSSALIMIDWAKIWPLHNDYDCDHPKGITLFHTSTYWKLFKHSILLINGFLRLLIQRAK